MSNMSSIYKFFRDCGKALKGVYQQIDEAVRDITNI